MVDENLSWTKQLKEFDLGALIRERIDEGRDPAIAAFNGVLIDARLKSDRVIPVIAGHAEGVGR